MIKLPLQNLIRARGLWLRVLVLWVISCTFPFFDEVKQFDLRFGMRGGQEASEKIVIIKFDQEDWTAWHGPNNNLLRSLKEFSTVNDTYFWNPRTWNTLLSKILEQEPSSVGVTFYFNPQLPRPEDSLRALVDPRVIWAGQLENDGRPALPLMANTYGYKRSSGRATRG